MSDATIHGPDEAHDLQSRGNGHDSTDSNDRSIAEPNGSVDAAPKLVGFIWPEINEFIRDFIKSVASSPTAEDLTRTFAKRVYRMHNPIDDEGRKAQEDRLYESEIEPLHTEKVRTNRRRADEPAHKTVDTTERISANGFSAKGARGAIGSFTVVILLGIANLITTGGAIVTKSGKLPLILEHPWLAVGFVAIPISMILAIEDYHRRLDWSKSKIRFRLGLFVVGVIFWVTWIVTLTPAYSPSGQGGDPFAPQPLLDIFWVHLSAQFLGEVVAGGLLKIGLSARISGPSQKVNQPAAKYLALTEQAAAVSTELEQPEAKLASSRLDRESHAAGEEAFAMFLVAMLHEAQATAALDKLRQQANRKAAEADKKLAEANQKISEARKEAEGAKERMATFEKRLNDAKRDLSQI